MNINYLKKYSLWIFSVLVNSFGNSLLIKSNMGSGPWIAASMGIAKSSHLQIGVCTIILNFLIYIPIIIISKKFSIFKLIGSFFVAYIFGRFLDFFLNLFFWLNLENIFLRVLVFLIGDIVLSAGISVYLRLNIAMNPFDQFLQTVNEYLLPDMKKANLVYLGVPLILALLFGIYNGFDFNGIGLGTLFMFFFNGVFIKFFHTRLNIPNEILSPRRYIQKH